MKGPYLEGLPRPLKAPELRRLPEALAHPLPGVFGRTQTDVPTRTGRPSLHTGTAETVGDVSSRHPRV